MRHDNAAGGRVMEYYEPPRCPGCLKSDGPWGLVQSSRPGETAVWGVCYCGTYFQWLMPTPDSFSEYYLGEYRRNFPVTASAARRALDILDVMARYGSGPLL